jgi:hypothetical protein
VYPEKGSLSADGVLTMRRRPSVRGQLFVTRGDRQVRDPLFSYQRGDSQTGTHFPDRDSSPFTRIRTISKDRRALCPALEVRKGRIRRCVATPFCSERILFALSTGSKAEMRCRPSSSSVMSVKQQYVSGRKPTPAHGPTLRRRNIGPGTGRVPTALQAVS